MEKWGWGYSSVMEQSEEAIELIDFLFATKPGIEVEHAEHWHLGEAASSDACSFGLRSQVKIL